MIFAIFCKISKSAKKAVNYDVFGDLDRKWTKIVARKPLTGGSALADPAKFFVFYVVSGAPASIFLVFYGVFGTPGSIFHMFYVSFGDLGCIFLVFYKLLASVGCPSLLLGWAALLLGSEP